MGTCAGSKHILALRFVLPKPGMGLEPISGAYICSTFIASSNISVPAADYVPKPIKMCIFFTLKRKLHVVAGSELILDLIFVFPESEMGLKPIDIACAV